MPEFCVSMINLGPHPKCFSSLSPKEDLLKFRTAATIEEASALAAKLRKLIFYVLDNRLP